MLLAGVGARLVTGLETVVDVSPMVGRGVDGIDAKRLDGVDGLEHPLNLRPAVDLQQNIAAGPDERQRLERFAVMNRAQDVDARDDRAEVVRGPSDEGESRVGSEPDYAVASVESLLVNFVAEPAEQLDRLTSAVRVLPDIHQRAALIIARWSGARRSEITRLEYDCLDTYPDGTSRLRIPAGKTGKERMVPLHPEAAAAIRELQALDPPGRGFADECTGIEVRRLFSLKGKCISPQTLFEASLGAACQVAGLVDDRGRATITAHRFRHTVGTELIEGGARVHTVMKMLGHTSTGMTLVYAHLSDATVREDYMKVLGPGALIAGPLAETLRSRAMPEDSLAWLKANFFRTELELGHCLRLPEEGPCECDLYLTCAKFVTTPEYAPRLRERRIREITLADEALVKGFHREAERHDCTRKRIEELLKDLGEPAPLTVD